MTSPTFQHRHYKRIASILASYRDNSGMALPNSVIEHFARELKGTNPNYSADRFERAAKGEPDGRDKVR